jgi:hypothetical protein
MQNLGTLRQLFLGDLADDGREREREEEEKIMPSLMATSLRWRTHSARTNLIRFLQPTSLYQISTTRLHSTWTLRLRVR